MTDFTLFDALPDSSEEALHWQWQDFEPYAEVLRKHNLTPETLGDWLAAWSQLQRLANEVWATWLTRLDRNTQDEEAERAYQAYVADVQPNGQQLSNDLNHKLVASGLMPDGFAVVIRNIKVDMALYRDDNLPLQTEVNQKRQQYGAIIGAQTVMWQGEERTLVQLGRVLQDPDRDQRQAAWQVRHERRMQDREALNNLWLDLFKLRQQIAHNADFDTFREYKWQDSKRFDYTPDDALQFHQAVKEVVVPIMAQIYEQKRQRLGVDTLRPWDLEVDVYGDEPLKPFRNGQELVETGQRIFDQVHPTVGAHFRLMRDNDMLDLENRKNKAPGAYCITFDQRGLPFIFMNSNGTDGNVRTLLHEAGHAFHALQLRYMPYHHTARDPIEFAEVASMAMELLAAPYLLKEQGGFYDEADYHRSRINHLENIIALFPRLTMMDAWQHYLYTHPEAALDPNQCDAKFTALWHDYHVGIDVSGLDDFVAWEWRRVPHFFLHPFYMIEYMLAQLGAIQVWGNAQQDQKQAVDQYLHALTLGYTVTLPRMYAAAGARFAFDVETLRNAMQYVQTAIETHLQQI